MLRNAWAIALLAVAISAHPSKLSDTFTPSKSSAVRTMCEEANALDKVDAVENSYNAFDGCMNDLVDFEQLTNDIEEVKTNHSDLNGVIKKYCAKTTQLKTCVNNYIDGIVPCATSLQKTLITTKNVDQFIDYICYNDGERIKSFVSEKGIECYEKLGSTILERCGDQSFEFFSEEDRTSIIKTGNTVKQCSFADKTTGCIVTSFKTCDPATPGNILEALFSFVRKDSVCNDALPKN